VSFFSRVGVDMWVLLWVTWVGSVPPVYSETLIGTDKTWWWPWMAETCCFDIDINCQEYTSFISYELCYWLPSHIDIFTHTAGMTLLKEECSFKQSCFLGAVACIWLFLTVAGKAPKCAAVQLYPHVCPTFPELIKPW